eukprot:14751870-Ditylum_brightwellii.AAC.1
MLGTMYYWYCILLAVGSFLEDWVEMGNGCLTEFLFCGDGQDPMSLNSSCYDILKKHIIDN